VAATTILIVRHGETDWNREGRFQGHADPPLNAAGREQAEILAEQLAGDGIEAIHTSDLRRAHETATIVADRLGLPVTAHGGLREIDVGAFQGLTREEIDARWPDARAVVAEHGYGAHWGGESLGQLSARVVPALVEIASAHSGERVLVVGHGGTIRAALARADGVDILAHRKVWPGPAGNCEVFELVCDNGTLRRPARPATADS
jgi:broad specificity phosphatase PhoE